MINPDLNPDGEMQTEKVQCVKKQGCISRTNLRQLIYVLNFGYVSANSFTEID